MEIKQNKQIQLPCHNNKIPRLKLNGNSVRCDIVEVITKLFLLNFSYLQILTTMEDSKPGSM